MKTRRHPQNRKYITYRDAAKGGPIHGRREMHKNWWKFGRVVVSVIVVAFLSSEHYFITGFYSYFYSYGLLLKLNDDDDDNDNDDDDDELCEWTDKQTNKQ